MNMIQKWIDVPLKKGHIKNLISLNFKNHSRILNRFIQTSNIIESYTRGFTGFLPIERGCQPIASSSLLLCCQAL